jgi:Ca-activated chloride channel homolog
MNSWRTLSVLAAAGLCLAWLNPTRDHIAAGNRLFTEGKFDQAIKTYGEVLVNDPDSPLLNFNMGDANYKAGKYAAALAAFSRVRFRPDDPHLEARTAYNIGNAEYRLGAAAEANKPQDALKAYAAALVAYRHAIGSDPTDRDAKFNYEFVSKKIEDLKKKLEEQKKQQQRQQSQQQQQPQNQQPGKQPAGQPPPAPKSQAEQQAGAQHTPQPQAGQQQANAQHGQQRPAHTESQPSPPHTAAGAATNGTAANGAHKNQMSPQEAQALIDTARNDELAPQEFARKAQGATVAEPAEDW